MPQNCSADFERVITHMDTVFTLGTKSEQTAFKTQFGMQNVTHLDDVASAMRNFMWDWQSLHVRNIHLYPAYADETNLDAPRHSLLQAHTPYSTTRAMQSR